jgi:predicted ester cyclase
MNEFSFSRAVIVAALLAAASDSALAAGDLTVNEAKAVIAPFYDALNQPAKKNVDELLGQSTSPEWKSCGGITTCLPRAAVITAFKARGNAIPDLKWAIVDVTVVGNTAIVRGEATGTPVAPVMGAQPTGKSFRVMSIDIHTIENKKMVQSYHVEDWAGAVRQLNAQ